MENNIVKQLEDKIKSLEKELKQKKGLNEDLWSLALFAKLNPNPVMRFNREGYITMANQAAYDLLINETLKQNNIKTIFTKTSEINIEKCIDNDEILFIEEKVNQRIYRCTIKGVSDLDEGQIYTDDISEVKKLETEKQKLLTAIEQTSNTILVTDAEGNIEFVNKSFEKITGYKKYEVIGKKPKILKTDYLSDEIYKELWETISQGKTWVGEFHNKKKDGNVYWEEATITPIIDKEGKIINYIAVKEDITEKKKTKEKLKTANIFLKSIIEALTYPFFVINPNTYEIELANKAGLKKNPIGKKCYEVSHNRTSPCFEGSKQCPLKQVLQTKKSVILEHKHFDCEGNEIYVEIHSYPIINENGDIEKIIEYVIDISQRKRAELVLTEYKKQLEQLVEERTRDLRLAKEKAEESDRLKTAFLANISHEIRTPMNAISNFSILLLDELDLDERNNYSTIVQENIQSLLDLLDSLIDLSRIEVGQIAIVNEKFNINEFILKLYEKIEKETQENENVELYIGTIIHDDDFFIETDIKRLEQVLMNLLQNAIKFTQEGYIEFGYSYDNKKELLFYVKDTGIGISEENKKTIFDRFRKINYSEQIYKGAGLGLSLAKGMVDLMGGKMWVESKEKEGSIFYFTIPYQKEEKITEKTEVRVIQKQYNWKEKIILIAEDQEANYIYLEEILRKTQVTILWARDGKQAVDVCSENKKINLILMDIQMPIMDGFEARKKIQKMLPNVPIIAQTAFTLEEDVKNILETGFTDYMSKSFHTSQLLSFLDKYLKT